MKSRTWLLIAIGIVAIFLHVFLQRSLFSLVPLSITAPFLITWLTRKPLFYLIAWAVLAELLTTFPIGILTTVTLTPFVLHFLLKRIHIDLSFSFLLITVFTVFFQSLALLAFDSFSLNTVGQLPLVLWASTIGLTSLFGYSVCLIVEQLYPSHE